MFTGEIRRARSRGPLYIGLVIVALIAAVVLFMPLPRTLKTTYKLEPIGSADVLAPRDGTIATLVASDGVWLEKGAVIAKYDTADSDKKLKAAEEKLAVAQKKLVPAALKKSEAGQAAVAKAVAAEQAAKAALEKAAAKGPKSPAVTGAEKKLAAAAAAVAKAKEVAGPSKAEVEQEVEALNKTIAAAKAELAAPDLVAPGAGVLATLTVKPGQVVVAGGSIGRLDDVAKLKAIIAAPKGETLKAGLPVDLLIGTTRRRVTLEKATPPLEVVLDNAKKELKAGTDGVAEITAEPRSLSGVF